MPNRHCEVTLVPEAISGWGCHDFPTGDCRVCLRQTRNDLSLGSECFLDLGPGAVEMDERTGAFAGNRCLFERGEKFRRSIEIV